jgi:hypothetical protein
MIEAGLSANLEADAIRKPTMSRQGSTGHSPNDYNTIT